MSDRNFRLKGGKIRLGPTYTPPVPLLPPEAPVLSGVAGIAMAALSWTATGDWYQLFQDGALVFAGTETSFTKLGLSQTAYNFQVVAVNNVGETASNVVTLTPLDAVWNGLVHYWTFDGTGIQKTDPDYFATDKHSGVMLDYFGVLEQPNIAVGKIGNGIGNPTNNAYYWEARPTTIPVTSWLMGAGFTQSIWFKREAGLAPVVLLRTATVSGGFTESAVIVDAINFSGTYYARMAAFDYNTNFVDVWSPSFSLSTWHFLCCGYDANTKLPFISLNGAPKVWGVSVLPGDFRQDNTYFITAQQNLPRQFVIDEFGLFSTVISDDQIAALYNGGAGLTYPFP